MWFFFQMQTHAPIILDRSAKNTHFAFKWRCSCFDFHSSCFNNAMEYIHNSLHHMRWYSRFFFFIVFHNFDSKCIAYIQPHHTYIVQRIFIIIHEYLANDPFDLVIQWAIFNKEVYYSCLTLVKWVKLFASAREKCANETSCSYRAEEIKSSKQVICWSLTMSTDLIWAEWKREKRAVITNEPFSRHALSSESEPVRENENAWPVHLIINDEFMINTEQKTANI